MSFYLLLVYTLDITFQPLKTTVKAQKLLIFRSQVSTLHDLAIVFYHILQSNTSQCFDWHIVSAAAV